MTKLIYIIHSLRLLLTGSSTGNGTRTTTVLDQFAINNTKLGTAGYGRSSRSLECRNLRPALKGAQLFLLSLATFILILTCADNALAATPGGTRIINIATATSDGMDVSVSNPAMTMVRSDATLEMMRYAPDIATADSFTLQATEYSSSANESGFFTPLDEVLKILGNPLPLVENDIFSAGSVVFFRLTDLDQNLNPSEVESVFLTVTVPDSNDLEFIRIYETGSNTGTFIGYLPSEMGTSLAITGISSDGVLQAPSNSKIEASYVDIYDGYDTQTESALFDPLGRVFDSITGALLDNVEVTLMDNATNGPANVFGNGFDGSGAPCEYPSTILTGSNVVDSCGANYQMVAGGFQFPRVQPGSYWVDVAEPAGYSSPSQVPFNQLQTLPNAPWDLHDPASLGGTFTVNPGPAFRVDIPLDPSSAGLWLSKTAIRDAVAVGDFLAYNLRIENNDNGTATGVTITDRLPLGFRYQSASAQLDEASIGNPQISTDGRTLNFAIGDITGQSSVLLSYVIEVAAGAPLGSATNSAIAQSTQGASSNQSSATVEVVEEFFNHKVFIAGRVMEGSCSEPDNSKIGLANARIYLEDGTYVITDGNGMFHIEGLESGVHVVQLDLDSLPEGYEALPCAENSQFAGRAFSQFIDLQGGTLWRTDFHVAPKPVKPGEISLNLEGTIEQNNIIYRVPFAINGVPLDNVRLTLTLPDGTSYLDGSALLNGEQIAPQKPGSTVTFNLGDRSADSNHVIELRVLEDGTNSGELLAKAYLEFDLPGDRNRRTPHVESRILREVTENRIALPEVVVRPRFSSFDTTLSPQDLEELREIAATLEGSELIRIDATGHTDDQLIAGRSRHIHTDNQSLSVARASSVIRALGEMLQLPPTRITINGYGSQQPVASNKTQADRLQNRRVELLIVAEKVERNERLVIEPAKASAKLDLTNQTKVLEKHQEKLENKPLHGITTPADGAKLTHPTNAIRIAFDSRLTPVLTLDGIALSDERISFTKIDPKNGTTINTYTGVDFGPPGQHTLQLKGVDPFGNARFEQTVNVVRTGEIGVIRFISAKENYADGITPIQIQLRIEDISGEAIEAPLKMHLREGNLKSVDDTDLESQLSDEQEGSLISVDKNGIAYFAPVDRAGRYDAVLAYDTFEVEVESWVKPKMRDWILVGFAEGTMGYNTFSGNQASLEEAGIDEHFYDDGQVKFFAKGAIKGEWLLTMAYDSDKPDLDGDSLYQIIDPDTYYPLYGDGTQQGYEASSASKIYVKLERDQFYALFGDMSTELSQTELSSYNRSMNGFKSEMQGEKFSYSLFAAETKQAFSKDEIQGDGTSGRYYLSGQDIVINSETVTIETRDRFHSEKIIETQTLARHTDYAIDYDDGSLFFKSPVPSKDENFNPIFIVARYETFDSADENFNYGGRVAVKLLDKKIEVGATYVHEEKGAGDGDLYGTDVTVELTPQTTLHAEMAATETQYYNDGNDGQAYLAKVRHSSNRTTGNAYYREQQGSFGLGQQNDSETSTRKYGVEGSYQLSPQVSVSGLAYHEDNLATDAKRDVAEFGSRYDRDRFGVHTGLRGARDKFDDGKTQTSNQWLIGGNWMTANRKLNLRSDYEQSLGNKDQNSDYPTLLTLGADYKLTEKISLFAEQEFSWGDEANTDGTRAGFKSTPWKGGDLRTAVEQQTNENGQRVFAIFGLGQSWQVNERWGFDASLDRGYTIKTPDSERVNNNVPPAHGADDDFTSVSVGSTYRKAKWTWWNRLETRQAQSEDKYGISTSVVGEPKDGVAVSAKALAFISKVSGGARHTDGNIRLGAAYRPSSSRWILLNRLDFYFDKMDDSDSDYDNWRIVNNLHANFRLNRKLQMSFYYGLKYVRDSYNGRSYSGYTDLIAFETRYNINKRWDIGLHGSMLHSWNSNQYDYSLGADVGYSPITNTWVSLGYNLVGFEDEDFSAAHYTAQGAYMRFRAKFDQQSVKDAAKWINR